MSITVDTVTAALTTTSSKLLDLDTVLKLVGADPDDGTLEEPMRQAVRAVPGVVLFDGDTVIPDPQWVITLVVEVLLRWSDCWGANCPACAFRQDIIPGTCQERHLPPGAAAAILEAALSDPGPYEADENVVDDRKEAIAHGLIHLDLLFFLVQSYLRHTNPDVVFTESVLCDHAQALMSVITYRLACRFTPSTEFYQRTGLRGFFTFVPPLVLRPRGDGWSTSTESSPDQAICAFTIDTATPEIGQGMTVYTRIRDIVVDCGGLDDRIRVTPTSFTARFSVSAWDIEVSHSLGQPVVVCVIDMTSDRKPGYRYPDQLQIIDSATIGTKFAAEKMVGSTVRVTEWSPTCQACSQPTWEQLVAREVGCATHRRVKKVSTAPKWSE